ncbi:transcriptional regulator [Rhodanobacter sp. DHG33]|uniref:helix-turn-helix domain-containing protein n=1 Tax=Rhodanobacter sp. DHG33 TaxID=2775921 RepID=UPI00177C09C6|nr:transcriptional regulator [Rhodanobacter sp. DHG33]MBD8900180.1 helix-turn-helix domain-containing protein [Rhodanobacter sp. DHG33]
MDAPYEDFAERLRKALDRTGFVPGRGRTSALAYRCGVSREAARKWLTGHALPELPRIIELAKDLGINLEWLTTGRGPMSPGVRETGAVYRRLTDNEGRLLDAFHKLPEPKRQLLVKFLS